jgi:hypothetical protein
MFHLTLLLEELNNLYLLNLCTYVVCRRFMEKEVFDESPTDLVFISTATCQILPGITSRTCGGFTDLTQPGWRINSDTVSAGHDSSGNRHGGQCDHEYRCGHPAAVQ